MKMCFFCLHSTVTEYLSARDGFSMYMEMLRHSTHYLRAEQLTSQNLLNAVGGVQAV
jgi:hypothetical protein